MVTVTARESFTYAGLNRQAGESFEASADDARILCMIGRADAVPAKPQSRRTDAVEAVEATEVVEVVEAEPRVARRSGRKKAESSELAETPTE